MNDSVIERCSYYPLESIQATEPRIELIKKQLESILGIVDLEYNGHPVKVNGFRLKNLSQWIMDIGLSPTYIHIHCSRQCEGACSFCYLKGNPNNVALAKSQEPADIQEIATRLKYYNPINGRGLFHSLFEYRETLKYPYIIEVLSELRKRTDRLFAITTNGSPLTERLIKELSKLQPILLTVSLISSTSETRNKLVKLSSSGTAIRSLQLLNEYGIPFICSITMSPDITFEDLEQTIIYADLNNPYYVRITLEGFTKLSNRIFDTEKFYPAVVNKIRELRSKVTTPLLVFPSMYEEIITESKYNLPRVLGVVRSSAAANAGIEYGDLITTINGLPVKTRPQVFNILQILEKSGADKVSIQIQRNCDNKEIIIESVTEPSEHTLRSSLMEDEAKSHFYFPFGIILHSGFQLQWLNDLKEIIEKHKARTVLFLSSYLMRPLFEQALKDENIIEGLDIDFYIEVPKNTFFGGNIFIGDMLVAEDFIMCIQDFISQKGIRPDLVIIPGSTFPNQHWRRDLAGVSYLQIEREVGINVELIECDTIQF
ncbi:hypothetical protein SY88_20320 [Clostridiales bacterium PH28_bin88]|nr:hypothetical protein SY88_20320 [Clostridiales bacterium PH28_bin88]